MSKEMQNAKELECQIKQLRSEIEEMKNDRKSNLLINDGGRGPSGYGMGNGWWRQLREQKEEIEAKESKLEGCLSELHYEKIVMPLGHQPKKITRFFFSKTVNERVFDSIIADMREEYNESLADGRIWRARWMHFYYTVKFWHAAFSLVSSKAVRVVWLFLKGC